MHILFSLISNKKNITKLDYILRSTNYIYDKRQQFITQVNYTDF